MKFGLYALSIAACILFFSCRVTIPETDETPPRFEIEISGNLPGGSVRFTSGDDLAGRQLNLLRNTIYQFRLTGSDQGGLHQLNFRVDWPTMLEDLSPESVEVSTLGEISRTLHWIGDRADPLSGMVITGKIVTTMYNQSYAVVSMAFEITASDYGGQSGTPNITRLGFHVGIVDDSQPLGWFDS